MTTQGSNSVTFETTHGTVSIHADGASGLMRVWSEPEPHPVDWREAREWIMEHSDGTLFDSYAEGSLDVFEVFMRPGVSLLPS